MLHFNVRRVIAGVSRKALTLGAVAAVAVPAAGAATYNVIDGSSIKDHTVGIAKLTPGARDLLEGSDGQDGARGLKGTTGPRGAKGDAGAAGSAGATGVTGADGVTGAAGSAGATGAKGEAGAAGSTGARGAPGDAGTPGTAGDSGASAFDTWKAADSSRSAATEADFLAALEGADGASSALILKTDNASGDVARSRNVQSVYNAGAGSYVVYSVDGTNFNPCVATVDAMTLGATSYAVTVNDTVEVHTGDSSGNPVSEPFTVTVTC
jgi:hypothetical protein